MEKSRHAPQATPPPDVVMPRKRATTTPHQEPPTGMNETRPSSKPLYQQVKQHLVYRVLKGEWKPGQCLPSEMRLAEEYHLSQGTVRKAIEEMASEGLVTRQAGKGTFVTSHNGDYQPFRFHRLYRNAGGKVAGNEATYLETRQAEADERIAHGLHIAPGSTGTESLRLRHLDTQPVLLERIFLSDDLCPEAWRILQQHSPGSIYLILEQEYNLLITKVVEQVRARAATAEEARFLSIEPGVAVLEVERVAYSLGGEPVEWRTMVGMTDTIHYRNEMG